MTGAFTRTGWNPAVVANWDAGDALRSLESAGCVEAADIALGHVLDAAERLRRYDSGLAGIYERKAGEVFMGALLSQAQAERVQERIRAGGTL